MLAIWTVIYILLVCGSAWADEMLAISLAPTILAGLFKLLENEEK